MLDGSAYVAIGKVLKPRGVAGEAFLLPLSDFPERYQNLSKVRTEFADRSHALHDLDYIRFMGSRAVIKFKGVETPEEIGRYRGAYIQVPRQEVHPLPENTFYVFDLLGMAVETASGNPLGRVVDVLSHPANDVYVIDRDGEELLIPAVREFVTIDRAARKMVVQEIQGLF